MKKNIFILLLITTFNVVCAQDISEEDYIILNQVMSDLLDNKNNINEEPLALYEKSLFFFNQTGFFSKETFDAYNYTPISKSDKKKINILAKETNFKYLADQKRSVLEWNFNRLIYPFKKYNEKEKPNSQFRIGIALPIYSEDKKTVFIFHTKPCNYMDCGATVVKVYKKNSSGLWKRYVNIQVGFD